MPDVNSIVEGLRTEIKNIALLVERLMTKQEAMDKSLVKVEEKVDELAGKSGKKWDSAVLAVISTLIGAFIGFLIKST